MKKKNKQQSQPQRSTTPTQVPAPVIARSVDLVVEAADAIAVSQLLDGAEEAVLSAEVDVAPATDTAPTGLTTSTAIRQAEEARRKFDAAREKLTKLQGECESAKAALANERRELGVERAKLRAEDEALAQRRRELVEREERIDTSEREARAGFPALREEYLRSLREERENLREELTTLRARMVEEQQRVDTELRQRLDAFEAEAREASTARHLAAEAERSRLRDELVRVRADALTAARAEANRILSAATADLETRDAALDARELELREREGAVRRQRREIEADRQILDEDEEMFRARVEQEAGRELADAKEQIAALTVERDSARAARDKAHQRWVAWEELERQLDGRTAAEILEELAEARGSAATLTKRLSEMPSPAALERARDDGRALDEARASIREHLAEIAKLKSTLAHRDSAAVEIENIRTQKEAHEARSGLLRMELDRLRQEYSELTKKDEAKHPLVTLVDLDERHSSAGAIQPLGEATTLADFALDLQQRLVHAIKDRVLHYSLRDVRSFLGGMAMSRLMLLQGISGTGKTSLPVAVASALGGDHAIIEVQAGWRDRQDLLGFYNAFHKHFYATEFLQALYRAGSPEFAERVSIIVLDEINLSRVEQFFADFLSMLEKPEKDQQITLMDRGVPDPPRLLKDGRRLPLPKNVWFVGTANHDETTTAFADKTYDRAHVMELPRHPAQNHAASHPKQRPAVPLADLNRLFKSATHDQKDVAKKAREWLSDPEGIAGIFEREFKLSWGNRLERDIARYVPVVCASGGSLGEATDHLLATKVLRRLRDRYDVRADGLQRVRDHLQKSWIEAGASLPDEARPSRSLALIDRELHAKSNGASA